VEINSHNNNVYERIFGKICINLIRADFFYLYSETQLTEDKLSLHLKIKSDSNVILFPYHAIKTLISVRLQSTLASQANVRVNDILSGKNKFITGCILSCMRPCICKSIGSSLIFLATWMQLQGGADHFGNVITCGIA